MIVKFARQYCEPLLHTFERTRKIRGHYCRFDFRKAVLEDVNFIGARFFEQVDFEGAVFHMQSKFMLAEFDRVDFSDAKFKSSVNFSGTSFTDLARFSGAHFAVEAVFDRVDFRDVADFTSAKFRCKYVSFDECTFKREAEFNYAEFTGLVQFRNNVRFKSFAYVSWVSFETVEFGSPNRIGINQPAVFQEHTWFIGTVFAKKATFEGCVFRRGAGFMYDITDRTGAKEGGPKFLEGANFDGASLNGVTFEGTDFGTVEVSFRNPATWSSQTIFDWDDDLSRKPANVKPDEWPPTVKPQTTEHQMPEDPEWARAQILLRNMGVRD